MLCCAALCCPAQVMQFIIARLTSWGSLMGLFPEGLPPIQNPAQPGVQLTQHCACLGAVFVNV